MSATVLVVDDIDFNVKLLETKLRYEFYEVVVARNGKEAIEATKQHKPDIILMDVMMPEMNGFDATTVIKNDPEFSHIPIVMVTALSAQEDKVKGLQCGADDFLTKPINDKALMLRMKSLLRIKMMSDELILRDETKTKFGISDEQSMERRNQFVSKHVLIIDDDVVQSENICNKLIAEGINAESVANQEDALNKCTNTDYSLVIISTQMVEVEGLRVFSQLRSRPEMRNTPFLITVDESDDMTLNRGVELGVNDYLITPVDSNELLARSITQIRRKNFHDELRDNFKSAVTDSVKDPLTLLYNRRYLDIHLSSQLEQLKNADKNLSVIMLDIDHFKSVNDKYGHAAGDDVIKSVAKSLLQNTRESDLCARYGGEEFVAILPNTSAEGAKVVADRMRSQIEGTLFEVAGQEAPIRCTSSFGIMDLENMPNGAEDIIAEADKNLYKAKEGGRNLVIAP